MKKALMLFAVIMITLTAISQDVTNIKIHNVTKVYSNGVEESEDMSIFMGIDTSNDILLVYYSDGSLDKFHYTIDRKYTYAGYNYIEGMAINSSSSKRVYLNMAMHDSKNIIIITVADNKLAMTFIGEII